ncbi:glycosyltransferase family 2 protein [soil metagenome]
MKISLITVCFNSAKHIQTALESVDAQSWPDIEHLIIDGGSTDGTLEIVRGMPRPWRRVVSEKDNGIYDAMNKGIRMATGDVVGFLNSDDFYASPDALQGVGSVLLDPRVDACYGDLCYVEPHDTSRVVRYWQSSPFRKKAFLAGWCPPHPTFYLRRSILLKHGAFDLTYSIAADIELMIRMMEVVGIRTRYVPGVLVHMRLGGTTNKSWRNIFTQNREIWRAMRSHGLQPSLPAFVLGKFISRGRQFVTRPA